MQLRTTHDQVENEEFEDMPESMLITSKLVCALAFRGVTQARCILSLGPPDIKYTSSLGGDYALGDGFNIELMLKYLVVQEVCRN